MPVRVIDGLPAIRVLRNENIFIMTHSYNDNLWNKSPINILILNLMPKKIETENQFLRLLSYYPLYIDVQFLCIDRHKSKHTSVRHMNSFYCEFIDIKEKKFDGLIITGAPLGLIQFCDITFWPQIKNIVQWAIKNVTSTLFICWAAHAALNILYNVPKMTRKRKLVGVYEHYTLNFHSLLTRGFDRRFLVPHSRNVDFPSRIIRRDTDLNILVESYDDIGAYLFASNDKRIVCVTGHPEYDSKTLADEYYRDLKYSIDPAFPVNYFPNNNPNLIPSITWRSHGHLLFFNWLHYCVYHV